ncbi:hypothetical protein ALC60_13941 [Trachymyrmex zeteki]|uniref:Uncharacterized protein n=1 Tax=Mycetomoellerius zeteki TaxID=64791 RepID=A0A151WGT3_9HYME|nr:hypothetical protein ALC60_13941 [Trachymyrmex zeteki]
MYSAVGSNARKNYYVPLQNIDETPSFTKRCVNAPVHRAVRILGRKYALTRTGYKFLEIGINVGPPSYVEIAIFFLGKAFCFKIIILIRNFKILEFHLKCFT